MRVHPGIGTTPPRVEDDLSARNLLQVILNIDIVTFVLLQVVDHELDWVFRTGADEVDVELLEDGLDHLPHVRLELLS